MTMFHFLIDLDDPRGLIRALQCATGETDVRLLDGWNGCTRGTIDPIDDEATGAVNVEWLRRSGRFSLDVQCYGHDIAPTETTARIARSVAICLKRSVLFSDCSAFGYSYFSAEPDGSIWAQLLVIDDENDELMDVRSYDHPEPRQRYPRKVFDTNQDLPQRAPGAPESWSTGQASCEGPVTGMLCTVFALPCPKHRSATLP